MAQQNTNAELTSGFNGFVAGESQDAPQTSPSQDFINSYLSFFNADVSGNAKENTAALQIEALESDIRQKYFPSDNLKEVARRFAAEPNTIRTQQDLNLALAYGAVYGTLEKMKANVKGAEVLNSDRITKDEIPTLIQVGINANANNFVDQLPEDVKKNIDVETQRQKIREALSANIARSPQETVYGIIYQMDNKQDVAFAMDIIRRQVAHDCINELNGNGMTPEQLQEEIKGRQKEVIEALYKNAPQNIKDFMKEIKNDKKTQKEEMDRGYECFSNPSLIQTQKDYNLAMSAIKRSAIQQVQMVNQMVGGNLPEAVINEMLQNKFNEMRADFDSKMPPEVITKLEAERKASMDNQQQTTAQTQPQELPTAEVATQTPKVQSSAYAAFKQVKSENVNSLDGQKSGVSGNTQTKEQGQGRQ